MGVTRLSLTLDPSPRGRGKLWRIGTHAIPADVDGATFLPVKSFVGFIISVRADSCADGKTSHMFLAKNFECTPLRAIACKSAQIQAN
jgi:hypothetical protein